MKPSPKPAAMDKSTQTDPPSSQQDPGQDRLLLSRQTHSLLLEDALPSGMSASDSSRAKLHRVRGVEEEDEMQEEDEERSGEQEKQLHWMSSVEEPIQQTTIGVLQREDFQDGSCSAEELNSVSASIRMSDQNLSSRSGPQCSIQEGVAKQLCVIPSS